LDKQIDICGDDGMSMTSISESCELHARIGWQGLTKKEYLDEGEYYLVTGVDFDNGRIDFEKCHYVTKDRYDQDVHIQLKESDILVTKDGTIGKVAIIDKPLDKPATLNSGVFVVRPKIPTVLSPQYLMAVLQSNHFERFIERIKVGCTIAHLNQEKFLNYEFPLPAIPQQQYVVNILGIVSNLIALRKRQLEMMDELVKARFVEMFGSLNSPALGCEIKTIQDVCEPIKDGTHQTPEYTDDIAAGFLFLSSKDVTTGYIDWNHPKYIPESLHRDLYSRVAPRKGDLLLAKNGTTGIAAVVDRDEIFDIYVSLAWLRPTSVDSVFLWGAINNAETKRQFDSSLKGIGVPNLHLGEIKKTRIVVGTKERQEQFSAFVTQIDKSKSVIQKSLVETQTLFDSLMQQYFG